MSINYSHGRERLQKHQKKIIIGDLRGVYGVDQIDPYYLYVLSLRSIFWGGDKNKEIILPNVSNEIQAGLSNIKERLLNVLSISNENIRLGNFRNISKTSLREPYMQTPYYFDDNYIKEHIDIFKLIRRFGDKVFLAHFIKNNGFENLIPSNTYTYLLNSNFDNVREEALNRFANKQSFIIKGGEGASGENMILVFFEKGKIYVAHSQTNGKKKQIKSKTDFLYELQRAIPDASKYKRGVFNINGYDENALFEQNYLIQDLIDTSKYEEKSINFFVSDEGVYTTTFGKNVAVGGVYKGNIEEVLPKQILDKFLPLVNKIKSKGYRGVIGFDFFYNKDTNDIKIIEANTRYTAPITPSMLVYKLQKQGKIPKNWTWRLIQKFETEVDLIKVDTIKKFDLVDSILKEKDIKDAKILVFSPLFEDSKNKYQSIIIIGPNQEEINKLYKTINLLLKDK